MVRDLGLPAEVECSRYQDFGESTPFDRITIRAVGGHATVLEWARGRLTASGEILLWTTVEGVAAIEGMAGWRVLSSQLPGLDCGRLARLQPCFT